jgi:hypothetical protein
LKPLGSVRAKVWVVPDAVKVPMANCPRPPTRFVVLASSVTALKAVAVASGPDTHQPK